jgi:hypothetical protein
MSGNTETYLKSQNYKILEYYVNKSNQYINGDYKKYPRKIWYLVNSDNKSFYNISIITKNHNDLYLYIKKNKLENIELPLENNKNYDIILNNIDIDNYYYYFHYKVKLLNEFIKENIKNKDVYLRLSNIKDEQFKTVDILKKRKVGDYFNPYGNWFSCGTDWIDFLYNFNKGLIHDNIHIIKIKNKRIKKISNKEQLRRFTNKYLNKKTDSFKNIIKWKEVEKDYDGLIICPFLKESFNKDIERYYNDCENNNEYDCRNKVINFIFLLNKIIGSDITKDKYNLKYEWHRFWDVASGVVWNNEEKNVSSKLLGYWDGKNWIKV